MELNAETALDLLPDFIMVLDANACIIEWNKQAGVAFGYTRSEALGQSFLDLLATEPVTVQSVETLFIQLAHSDYWEGEVALNPYMAAHAWFFIRAKRLELSDGQEITIISDTSLVNHEPRHHRVQAALDYSQRELSGILSAVGDTICSYDVREQKVFFISPSCQMLTGYTEHEFMDDPSLFLDIVSPQYQQLVRQAFQMVQLNQPAKVEYSLERCDGQKRWVLNSMTPVMDGDSVRVICVITDITPYRELNELKSRMMRMASHDLKNPLSAAIGLFELLMSELELNDSQRYIADGIQRAYIRMTKMLEELLETERHHATQDAMEQLDLRKTIQDVIDEFSFQIQKKKHSVIFEPPPTPLIVIGDKVQLHHALSNYVSNAIKYTAEQGCIRLHAYLRENRIYLEVADNGYGIPKTHQNQLFEAFFRAKQPGTEQISGTGVGLSLVKSVIVQHGGDVFYRPVGTGGSIFGWWLPVHEA